MNNGNIAILFRGCVSCLGKWCQKPSAFEDVAFLSYIRLKYFFVLVWFFSLNIYTIPQNSWLVCDTNYKIKVKASFKINKYIDSYKKLPWFFGHFCCIAWNDLKKSKVQKISANLRGNEDRSEGSIVTKV